MTAARPAWRGWRKTRRPSRRRCDRAAGAREQRCSRSRACRRCRGEQDRPEHAGQQRDERRERDEQQRSIVAVERADAGQRDAAEDRQREQVQQRLRDHRAEHDRQRLARAADPPRDDQRTRGLAQAGGQRRGHQHADERSLHRVAAFGPPPGGRRAEDRVPGDRAREHRRAHQRKAGDEQARLGREQRRGHTRHADPLERQRGEAGAGQRRRGEAGASQRADASLAPDKRGGLGRQRRQALGGHARLQVGGREAVAQRRPRQPAARAGDVPGRRTRPPARRCRALRGDVRPGEALGALARGERHALAARLVERTGVAAPRRVRAGRPRATSCPSMPSRTTSR